MRVRYIFSSRKTRMAREVTTNRHKDPFPKVVKEMIRTCDIILEVLDARFIEQTRNIEIENLIKKNNKKIIYILNKCDLVDIKNLIKNIELDQLEPYVFLSTYKKIGRSKLITKIKIEVKRLKLNKTARVGVIGYPNTGKSSLINFITGRGAAKTAPESGFTKGIQKIRLTDGIHILDTPGVIPDKENATDIPSDLKKHAMIGVKTYDKVKNPDFVVSELMKSYPNIFEKFYNIEANGDSELLIETLGRKKHWLLPRNIVDIDKTCRFILRDWQEGKIKIT